MLVCCLLYGKNPCLNFMGFIFILLLSKFGTHFKCIMFPELWTSSLSIGCLFSSINWQVNGKQQNKNKKKRTALLKLEMQVSFSYSYKMHSCFLWGWICLKNFKENSMKVKAWDSGKQKLKVYWSRETYKGWFQIKQNSIFLTGFLIWKY